MTSPSFENVSISTILKKTLIGITLTLSLVMSFALSTPPAQALPVSSNFYTSADFAKEAVNISNLDDGILIAKGGRSHTMMKMCAKIQYQYKNKKGEIKSGVTEQECDEKFMQQHKESKERKKSRKQACKKAWKNLPKLKQGEKWLERSCKPYQQK